MAEEQKPKTQERPRTQGATAKELDESNNQSSNTIPKEPIPSVDELMAAFHASDDDMGYKLKLKPGVDTSWLYFYFFTWKDRAEKASAISAEKFVPVTRDGAILGVRFSDLFEPEAFDEVTGAVTCGTVLDGNQRPMAELYLYAQPMTAHIARERLNIQASETLLARRTQETEDAMRSQQTSKVQVTKAEFVDDDDDDFPVQGAWGG